ncbi:MAG TPA: BON domain-containing protein [Xanthomonadales bacterium]|nr:BON domain-containing protein [Xanthomonadales bacterium]
MPNQNPNGRNMNRERDDQRPSWRQQDMTDDDRSFEHEGRNRGDRERMSRGGNESRWGARRDWDDDHEGRNRDEGYRTTDRHGGGQSGYGSGRYGDDRSMGAGYRNQSSGGRGYDDRQGMHTDDRFTGRGGSQYWDERGERGYQQRGFDDRFERTGYNSGYNQGSMGYGGYGQQGLQQNVGSQQGFRGAGNAGAQFADDYNRGRDFDQGMGYGQGHGFGLGQGMGHQGQRQGGPQGHQGYFGQSGINPNSGYGPGMQGGYRQDMGGYGPQGMQGSYGGSQGMQGPQGGYGQQGWQSHRGKGPQGYTRSDDRIREQVCEMLSDDDHIDATHIEVVVKNGEVILTGTVEDRRMKRLAEDLVERAPGVKDVQNQLRVAGERRGNQNLGNAVGKNETETSSTDKKHRA